MMVTKVNGEERVFDEGTTLEAALRQLGIDRPGIAVAVNDDVVPSAQFGDRRLKSGDVIEIIRAVAGG